MIRDGDANLARGSNEPMPVHQAKTARLRRHDGAKERVATEYDHKFHRLGCAKLYTVNALEEIDGWCCCIDPWLWAIQVLQALTATVMHGAMCWFHDGLGPPFVALERVQYLNVLLHRRGGKGKGGMAVPT